MTVGRGPWAGRVIAFRYLPLTRVTSFGLFWCIRATLVLLKGVRETQKY